MTLVSTARNYALIAVVAVIVLATTNVWNPFPRLWGWISATDPVAPGVAQWQASLGGAPQSIRIAGDSVIVEYRTSVEAYGLGGGVRLWKSDADWAATAGAPDEPVVVTGRLLTKGYQVLDPRTGAVRRTDTRATAVWAYSNAVLDLHCASGDQCELTAWEPRGPRPLWTVSTAGIGFVLNAADPDLPDTQPLSSRRVDDQAAGPGLMPSLIGLPGDGKVRIVDTAVGRVVQTIDPGPEQRVSVTGGRVLTVTGRSADGTCYYDVVATDPPAGQALWRRDGLNLRTADDGSSCKQDRDPAGGQDVVLGVDPTGHEELISAHDGRRLWLGAEDEDVLAVDDRHAIVRSADRTTVSGRSLSRDRTVWRRAGGKGATAALTPYAAIITGEKPGRITAVAPSSGVQLADVRTDAKVFTAGPGGLIAVAGRQMVYLPLR